MGVTVGLVLNSFLLGRTHLAILFFEFFRLQDCYCLTKLSNTIGFIWIYFGNCIRIFSMRYEHLPFIIGSPFFSFQAIVLLILNYSNLKENYVSLF